MDPIIAPEVATEEVAVSQESTAIVPAAVAAAPEKKKSKRPKLEISLRKRHAKKAVGHERMRRPGLRRIARRAGCKRISRQVYDFSNAKLREFLGKIVLDAVVIMEGDKRKTMAVEDVVYALKNNGQAIYGFGE